MFYFVRITVGYNPIKKPMDLDVAELLLNNGLKLPSLLRFSIYTLLENANKPYFSPSSTFTIPGWQSLVSRRFECLTITMDGLLQTQKHALSLQIAPAARVSSPTCPAYKNGHKIYNYQTVTVHPVKFLLPKNMENNVQNQIEHILSRAHSLEDLTADEIAELRCVSQQSLVIDKFEISPTQYWDWVGKVGDNGVEFNAQDECIILKEYPGWMHEATTHMLSRLFNDLEDRLGANTGSYYDSTGSTSMYITRCVPLTKVS